ncbi:MAG: hypothetical protein WAM82_04565 [Thermoanaerobaculia bacterium]
MTQHEHAQHKRRLEAEWPAGIEFFGDGPGPATQVSARGSELERQGGLRLESRAAGNLPARCRKPGSDSPPSAP